MNDRQKKQPGKRENRRENPESHSGPGQKFTRFFLNVGRRDGVLPQGLIGKINGVPGVGRIEIGKIEIMRNTALIEADSRYIPQVLGAFQHFTINGKTVSIEVARGVNVSKRPKKQGMRKQKGRKLKAA